MHDGLRQCGLRHHRAGGRPGSWPRHAPSGGYPSSAWTPALPSWRRLCSSLATSPIVARHSMWIFAHFTRAHTHLGVHAFAGQQRRRRTSRAGDLRTCTGLSSMQWMVEPRDVADRQRVATRIGASEPLTWWRPLQGCAERSVATLAVGVAHQSDVGRTLGSLLDALNLAECRPCCDEVHHAVVVFVTTAPVTGGDLTVVACGQAFWNWGSSSGRPPL